MGRAEVLFAACAVAVALLAGTACAIASADPADTSAGESTNEPTSGDERQSANESTVDDANTYSGDNDSTGGEDTTGGEEESGGDRADDDNADDSGAPDGRNGRTANKMPSKLPEAPPVDILPLPEELPPLPLEPPLPPADLPPGEPDAVDVTMVGPGASQSARNESPAIKLPAIIAPPALPGHILGTSITARGISRAPVTTPSRGSGEPLPSPRQPTTGLRGLPVTSAGLSGHGQTAYRTGYNKDGLPRVRWLEMAAGALPGIGGMIVMTAAGVCLGYRQATAAQRLQAYGVDRFLT